MWLKEKESGKEIKQDLSLKWEDKNHTSNWLSNKNISYTFGNIQEYLNQLIYNIYIF